MIRELLTYLASTGNAEQFNKSSFLIYWKKPTEWADLINDYVQRVGLSGSIVTVYELFMADEAASEVFHGLPDIMWPRVFRALERSGKAALFGVEPTAKITSETGIKFS